MATTPNGKPGFWGRVSRTLNFNQIIDRPTGEQMAASPPRMGEQTGNQTVNGGSVTLGGMPFAGGGLFLPGRNGLGQPLPGTLKLYRRMSANPTVAIARMVNTVMLQAADWSYKAVGADVPDERIELVKRTFEPIRRRFIADVGRALDYGFSPFEKVWVEDQGDIIYAKIKPLLVDSTEILVDKASGAFSGLKAKNVELTANKSFLFTYDGEAGNLYGRPLNENIKQAYSAWERDFARYAQYLSMSAQPIPMIEYPLGRSQDASGAEQDNQLIAMGILQSLQSGMGVTMPKQWLPWAQELLENGANASDLAAWTISWLEPKSARGKEFLEALRYWDRLMLRGRLAPERTVTEGEHGTKAEVEAQTDIVILNTQDLLDDIMECVNGFLTDPLLVVNFGPEAKGTVKIEASPIVDNELVYLRKIVELAVGGQLGVDLLTTLIDTKTLIEKSGVPINEEATSTDMMDELIRQEEERSAREEAAANNVPPTGPGQSGHDDDDEEGSEHNSGHQSAHEPAGKGGK